LEYIDNNVDVSTGTFAARAQFKNETEKLWPGMFVNIALDLGNEKNALTIPAVAIQGDEGARFVFTVDMATKKAARKPVEVSRMIGESAIIVKGLNEGDEVITDGLLRVTDGAMVDAASTPAPAAKPVDESAKP
jgi:multidrug efflux system membrane fusion protein